MLLHMASFHFLWLSNIPLYTYTTLDIILASFFSLVHSITSPNSSASKVLLEVVLFCSDLGQDTEFLPCLLPYSSQILSLFFSWSNCSSFIWNSYRDITLSYYSLLPPLKIFFHSFSAGHCSISLILLHMLVPQPRTLFLPFLPPHAPNP